MNYTGQVKDSTTEGQDIIHNSQLIPQSDPNGRKGWLFEKIAGNAQKFNLYYWSQGNRPKTTISLFNISAVLTIDSYQDIESLPYINIYTKPKGDGTDINPFYNALRTYSISASQDIEIGQRIEIYSKTAPINHNHIRQVAFNVKTDTGPFNDIDEIKSITISSSSIWNSTSKILIEGVGVSFIGNGKNNEIYLELVSDSDLLQINKF